MTGALIACVLQIHWGINLPVLNKYTGALFTLCLTKYLACENIRLSSLFAAVDVPPRETSTVLSGEERAETDVFAGYKIHWGINLPVSDKYTGAFIFPCLTNKRLNYLLFCNKFIYVILYQYNGN